MNFDSFVSREILLVILNFSSVTNNWLLFVLQANLALREGSGHFFVNTSVKGIANVVYQESQSTAQVRKNTWSWFGNYIILHELWYRTNLFYLSRFLPSIQAWWRWWFMTFVWLFHHLPKPLYTFLISWRFTWEWWTRSVSIIAHLGGSRHCLTR